MHIITRTTRTRRAAVVAAIVVAVALQARGLAQSQEQQIINDAAAAMGGRDRIVAAKTLRIEGLGFDINYGQGHSWSDVGVQSEVFYLNPWKRVYELGPRRGRFEQARTAQHAFYQAQVPQQSVQALDGAVAFNIAGNGNATRQFGGAAQARQVEYVRHPLTLLRTALDANAKLSNARTQGSDRLVDVAVGSSTVTLAIDGTTKLPTRMFWTGVSFLGDTVFQTVFADYRDVSGLKLPTRLTYRSDRFVTADLRLLDVAVDGDVGNLAAPANVAAATPPPTGPGGPALPAVTVKEITKGVFHMTGQTHHSMLVEFSDHMVLIEAPNEPRVLAVMAKARELRPNKPVTKLVVSHHHSDHTSGLRAAVAEGINEVIIHTKNIPYAQELLRRPWTVAPDTLAKKPSPKQVKFTGVSDALVLKDSFNEVQLHYVLDNTHSDNMLSIYFPASGIYTQADIYMPDDPRNIVAGYAEGHAPWVQNVYHNLVYRKLNVQQHVPLHGDPVPQSQFLESALRLQLNNPLKRPSTN